MPSAHIDTARPWALLHQATTAGDTLLQDEALATRFIGDLRYDLWQERISQLEQALAATRRLGNRHNEGHILNVLGVATNESGAPRRAIEYYQQSLIIAQKLKERAKEAIPLAHLGIVYTELGDIPQAIHYTERALAINRELGNRYNEAASLTNLGRAYETAGMPRGRSPISSRRWSLRRNWAFGMAKRSSLRI